MAIILYRAPFSRSFTALWMLEELGVAYESRIADFRTPPLPDAFLALNPLGKVPVVTDGDTVLTESPAICLHLADRYSPGDLAPAMDDPKRGDFLSWLVFATAVLDPARATQAVEIPVKPGNWGYGWSPLARVLERIAGALKVGPFLLGERFTAADVMVDSLLAVGQHTGEIPPYPELDDYTRRLSERSARVRAAALNWPSA